MCRRRPTGDHRVQADRVSPASDIRQLLDPGLGVVEPALPRAQRQPSGQPADRRVVVEGDPREFQSGTSIHPYPVRADDEDVGDPARPGVLRAAGAVNPVRRYRSAARRSASPSTHPASARIASARSPPPSAPPPPTPTANAPDPAALVGVRAHPARPVPTAPTPTPRAPYTARAACPRDCAHRSRVVHFQRRAGSRGSGR